MRHRFLTVAVVCLAGAVAAPAPALPAGPQGLASTDSRHLVDLAIEAMGGLETLRALHTVRISGFEHQNMLEQSERPEGPYIVMDGEFEEIRDLNGMRLHQQVTNRSIVHPPGGMTVATIVAGDLAASRFGEQAVPGGPGTVELAQDSLMLGPERVLLAARGADDLRGTGIVEFQGVTHDVVSFSRDGRDVSVYLNRHTDLPSAVEWTRVFDDGFWGVWGDVTARMEYSLWFLEPGGFMFPRQWTESRNGMPYRDRTITSFEANPEIDEELFALGDDLRAGMEARAALSPERVELGLDFRNQRSEGVDLAPGIVMIEGMWNVVLVEQPDGVVVIEAPISSPYSEQVLADAERRFPGLPVKGVVTTSDAWPHVGGIREYVAREIPIHALELNVPLLERIIEAPRTRRPDRLAGWTEGEPRFELVHDAARIGDGPTGMVLYPIRGEGGERMVAAYFPAHRLLYASDLIQPGQADGFFMPSYLAEVEALVGRHDLDVETVVAMHLGPTPWQAVLDALTAVRSAR